MTAARVPLTVIGGFLGAGKTTLLNRILQQRGPGRTAVLVNDFGDINIDASLIVDRDAEIISLANGCVCCSVGSGLEDALIRVLQLDPLPEWIVIEASGVSDPARIAQVGMADPQLQLEGVVVLADASQIREQADDALLADTVRRQLDAADLLVLNKSDLLEPGESAEVSAWLHEQGLHMPVLSAEQGDVPLHVLLDLTSPHAAHVSCDHAGPGAHAHAHDMPDHPFETWTWHPAGEMQALALTQAMKSLPREVIRAKGWVRTDRHGPVLMQYAGRRLRFDSKALARTQEGVYDAVVFIGLRGHDLASRVSRHLAAAGIDG